MSSLSEDSITPPQEYMSHCRTVPTGTELCEDFRPEMKKIPFIICISLLIVVKHVRESFNSHGLTVFSSNLEQNFEKAEIFLLN